MLSPGNLRRVLDASRAARPLPGTPLRAFVVVQQRLMDPSLANAAAVDFVLIDWLTEEIVAGLRDQRQHYRLPGPDLGSSLEEALDELALDFAQGVNELEAWSVLYHRYARVDLDLSWGQLETVTAQDERTLRRRQERGMRRLTQRLLARERAVKQATHRDRLRRILPAVPDYQLVGRAAIEEQAWQALVAEQSRRHVALVGPGGIGKTALAALLAHRLIDAAELDNIAWLTASPPLMPQDLPAYCVQALNVPFLGEETLRAYCQAHDVLIVLDEAEQLTAWADEPGPALQPFLEQVAEARLIITSRFFLRNGSLRVLELPELDVNEALVVIERTWPADHALDSIRREVIWRQAGGNPLALEVSTRLAARLPQSVLTGAHLPEPLPDQLALWNNLYEHAWQQLDADARCFWLATWLLPPSYVLPDLAELVSGQGTARSAQSAHRLRQLSLLAFDTVHERYVLHSVARAYLCEKIKHEPLYDWVRIASQRLSGAVLGSPYAAQLALHLVELAELLGLSLVDRVKLIQAAWPNIAHQGLWATWRPVLEAQVDAARRSSHPVARAALLRALGVACRWLGRYDRAEMYLEEALQFADQSGSMPDYVQTLAELAVVYRYQGHLSSAQTAARHALVEFRRQGDAAGVERCLLELAQLALDRQQPQDAIGQLEAVPLSARSAALACNAHLLLNDLQEALIWAERAVMLAADDRPNQARAQATLGRVFLELGRLSEAEDHLSLALSLLEQQHDMLGWARAASTLAQVYSLAGNLAEAEVLLDDAAAQQRLIQDRLGLKATLQAQLSLYASMAEAVLKAGREQRGIELTILIREIDAEWRALGG